MEIIALIIGMVSLIINIIYTCFKIRDSWRKRKKEKTEKRLLKAGGIHY